MVTKDPSTGKFTTRSIPATQRWANWKDVKPEQWPWKHFTPEEIACRGTGKLVVHKVAMDKLESLRVELGKPMILNSAYRSPEHNKAVGGEANSYHMAHRIYNGEEVMAFDVSMANLEPYAFEELAKKRGFNGTGHYPLTKDGRRNFMHIDNGPPRHWNLGGDFQKPVEKPADVPKRFDAEPQKPKVLETLLKPEILAPVGTLIAGSGVGTAVQDATNPIAWAVGGILLLGAIGLGVWFFINSRAKVKTTTQGMGD